MNLAEGFTLCYITDRKKLPPGELSARIREAIEAEVSLVQIREKDMEPGELLALVASAVNWACGRATKIVVNDRLDVALAAGAQGVHLGGESAPPELVRARFPKPRLMGVSCHSLQEARVAEKAGADYILLAPIFPPLSKVASRSPLGLERLREVSSEITTPVLALGGITPERVRACREAGAAGVAGISLFQECPSLKERVAEIHRLWG